MDDETVPRAAAQPHGDWWRPTRPLIAWLTGSLLLQAVVTIVLPLTGDQAHQLSEWHRAFEALLDGRQNEATRIYDNANRGSNPWSVIGLVGLLSLVLLVTWMWRSMHNARAQGRTGARLSPGWAIGAWFIPLANYVLLYLLYSDLWRMSDPDSERGDSWRRLPGPPVVRTFWGIHVTGAVVWAGTTVLAVTGVTNESTTRALLIVGAGLVAAGALLNIVVVRDITARQEAIQARDPAATEGPAARRFDAPAAVDGPGWYADPSRRFDHRYWDGSTWTEHVSRGGVTSTAPVVPADWYPDPTGRFHWRYWTGHEWTEHVSRDQELFVDPLEDD